MASFASLPDWALLDRCISDGSFPGDEPTEARCANSIGDEIRICFRLHEPPRPSRICLSWPAGAGEFDRFSVVAAHRDAVLFQMIYQIPVHGRDFPWDMYDYFLYTAGGGGSGPSLVRLPSLDGTIEEFRALFEKDAFSYRNQHLRRLEGLDLGVVRRGEEDCAVVELQIDRLGEGSPELHVIDPLTSGSRWQVRYPKIVIHHSGEMDEEKLLWNWCADTVVPIGSYLCWVDYCLGGILVCDVFDASSPGLQYLPFPAKMPDLDRDLHGRSWSDVYQTVGVNEDHAVIKFIMVLHGDGTMIEERFSPAIGFMVTSWTLKLTAAKMAWEVDAVVKSDDLWKLDAFAQFPHTPLQFPLISMADPNITYFVLREQGKEDVGYEYDDTWLVSIDMTNRAVKSSCHYIKGKEEKLYPEEAKFIKGKFWYFDSFLPTELPKYLKHGVSALKQGQGCRDPLHGLLVNAEEHCSRN